MGTAPSSSPDPVGEGPVDARMRGRGGIPLATKLILATGTLVVVSVGAAAFYSVRTIDDLARRDAAARRVAGEAAMQQASELLARNTATSAALPLAEGNQGYLDDLTRATVAQDPRIQWLLIADEPSGRIRTRTEGAPAGDTLADELRPRVAAAAAGQVLWVRDPAEPTSFTVASRVQVGEQTVGQLRMAVSTRELEQQLQTAIDDASERARASMRHLALVAGVILLLGIGLAAFEGIRMAAPLHLLSEQASRVAGGEFHHRVDVRTGGEIGALADNFNFMAERLGVLLDEMQHKASLERELELARQVQMSMVPPPHLISHGGLRIVGHTEAAAYCGGDWWTVRRLPRGRIILVVGDVTGHGMPAAMIAASARGAVEGLGEVDEELLTPEKVLYAIDAAIRNIGAKRLLMTCFAALIDPRSGLVDFANAGHNFPYVLHMDESRVLMDMSVLAARGNPLGGEADQLIQSGRQVLVPGDLFVLYTDGVIDRLNGAGERFSERRLRKLLLRRTLGTGERELPLLRDVIVDQMSAFAGGCPADDDVTLVLCQYEPEAGAGSPAVRRGATGTG